MIGPFVSALWPSIPPGLQKALVRFAEHEDIIAALFAWAEYGQQIKRYVDTINQQNEKNEDSRNGSFQQTVAAPVSHVDVGRAEGNFGAFADATPFLPIT
jgi:hypothetical protein